MVRKFRKKPVVIEAMQWNGNNEMEIALFMGKNFRKHPRNAYQLQIQTLEGLMVVNVGDWIIRGVNGEFYPCKPDIFEKTYEEIIDDARK